MATANADIWISSSKYIKTEPNDEIPKNQFDKKEKSLSGSPSLESKNHHNNDNTVETYKESLNDFLSEFKCYQDGQTTELNQHIGATHLRAMIALSKASSAEQQTLFQEIFKKTFISEGGSVEVLKRFILDSTGLKADEKEFCEQQISNLFPETSSLILDPVNKQLKNDSGSTNELDAPPAQPSLPGGRIDSCTTSAPEPARRTDSCTTSATQPASAAEQRWRWPARKSVYESNWCYGECQR